MPTYLFLFMMFFASSLLSPIQQGSLFRLLLIIFFVTFVIPAISIGTLRLSNFISDLALSSRRERILPFLFVTCFYGISTYMFYAKLSINNMFFLVFATTTVLLLILTIITAFWKISIHGAGIGGVLGFILAIGSAITIPHFSAALSVIVILIGLVIYARLKLQAHTPNQVYGGVLLGFVICSGSMLFFL